MLKVKDDNAQVQYINVDLINKEYFWVFGSVTSREDLIRETRVWRVFRPKTTYLTPERRWNVMVKVLSDII